MATTEVDRTTQLSRASRDYRAAQSRSLGLIVLTFSTCLLGLTLWLGLVAFAWPALALGFLLGIGIGAAVLQLGRLGMRGRWPAPR